jgi:RNA polymerase sigma factor (sigma-70 family)
MRFFEKNKVKLNSVRLQEYESDSLMVEKRKNIVQTVNQYGRQLLGFIRGKVATDEDAEDIIQDVWYQFSNVAETDTIESISGWLYRVAKNKITDTFRKKKPEHIEDYIFESEDGEVNFKEILLAETTTPEDEFFKKMFWEELMNALEELPEKQRSVFIQNELEDKTLQQIADETGESIKTITSRKGYAVKHLRNRLNNLYNDFIQY